MTNKKDGISLGSIDAHVGKRISQRRAFLGISVSKLAKTVGIGYQQMRKHEAGESRVGASRLYQISEQLDVSVTYFFEDLSKDDLEPEFIETIYGNINNDPKLVKEIEEVAELYYNITDKKIRNTFLELAKSLAENPDKPT